MNKLADDIESDLIQIKKNIKSAIMDLEQGFRHSTKTHLEMALKLCEGLI